MSARIITIVALRQARLIKQCANPINLITEIDDLVTTGFNLYISHLNWWINFLEKK